MFLWSARVAVNFATTVKREQRKAKDYCEQQTEPRHQGGGYLCTASVNESGYDTILQTQSLEFYTPNTRWRCPPQCFIFTTFPVPMKVVMAPQEPILLGLLFHGAAPLCFWILFSIPPLYFSLHTIFFPLFTSPLFTLPISYILSFLFLTFVHAFPPNDIFFLIV